MGKGIGSARSGPAAEKTAASVVASTGGASGATTPSNTVPAKQAHYTKQFAGVSGNRAAANRVARSLPPVQMLVAKERGRWRAYLNDGRHRVAAAKAAGATQIRAAIELHRPGRRPISVVTVVKI